MLKIVICPLLESIVAYWEPDIILQVADDVTFEVKDSGEIQKVEMVDQKKASRTDVPKTGDDVDIALLVVIMMLSLASMGGCIYLMKATKKKKK